ncbi:MAG: UDP-glucose/GDP-mannose dehydrogenase family protein [Candidatus Levyibacteriota bacterium]|nr:MAG: UDP-glucose/GDP-mannose dehydrogenase family protein [Candidatus Levybacteria bacterium]
MKNSIMKKKNDISIGILGLWHLGLVYGVSLAKSGYSVLGFDQDIENIAKLNKGDLPIYEPNLTKYCKKYLHKNLRFSSNAEEVIKGKDYIFITLDTPVNNLDEINLDSLHSLFYLVAKYSSKKTTIVISSQVPVGTTRSFIKKLHPKSKVIYFPENLKLGTAINDFLKPSAIVLGCDDKKVTKQFLKDFPIFRCKVLELSFESAEMVKHALNSFLAMNISFASEISDLCELLKADATEVFLGLKSDPRVSSTAPISPGMGFAGGTLGRDIKILINLANNAVYKTKLLNAIYEVNQDRLSYLLGKIKKVYPILNGKKIGILGLTYKPNTNTLRRSRSLELANLLFGEKAKIKGFDPAINDRELESLQVVNSYEELLKDLDLLILMTEWPQFRNINPKTASSLMAEKIIIDTRNFLDRQKYVDNGFIYFGRGKGE